MQKQRKNNKVVLLWCDNHAAESGIISKMPKWLPGQQRGEPMEQTFVVMIFSGMNDH